MAEPTKQQTPYEFLQAWSVEHVGSGVPDAATLKGIEEALHAVEEFLVKPTLEALVKTSEGFSVPDGQEVPVPERYRPLTLTDIARLVLWTDALREECDTLGESVADIVVLAHEDLADIADGYLPGIDSLNGAQYAELRRFHGLDRKVA